MASFFMQGVGKNRDERRRERTLAEKPAEKVGDFEGGVKRVGPCAPPPK